MPINGEKHHLTRRNVEMAPRAPGVYALYCDGEVVYYGAAYGDAQTLRDRLHEHLTGQRVPDQLSAGLFSYEATRYPRSREAALLEDYRRSKRCLPPFNEPDSRRGRVDGGRMLRAAG